MAEIKAQTAGFDNATFLPDMGAQNLPQGGVEQMGGSMIPHRRRTKRAINDGD
jgi:hypothetical protein